MEDAARPTRSASLVSARPPPAASDAAPPARRPTTSGFTPEGLLALLLVGVIFVWSLAQGDYLVFLFAALVLGVIVAARFLPRRGLEGLRIERVLPRRARVGVPMALTTTIRKDAEARTSVGLEVEDRTAASVRPGVLRIDIPLVGPDQPAVVRTSLTPQARGLLRLDGVVVGTRFPLGVAWARARFKAPVEVLVRPAEGRLTQLGSALLGGSLSRNARALSSVRGDDLFHGVREFRPGDSPRRVHWRTSARHGELRVAEWRADRGDDMVLVLGPRMGEGPRPAAHFERAIRVAATLWRALHKEGRPVRLVGPTFHLEASGRRSLPKGLDALARIDPALPTRPVVPSGFAKQGARRPTILVLASGAMDPDTVQRMLGGQPADEVLRCDLATLARYVRGLR